MTIFTVHAPPAPEGAEADPAALVFVKEGFSWPALIVPPLSLLWHRMWLVLLLWLVAVVGLSVVAGLAGSDASSAVMLLFALWFALEANALRRWSLERRGYALRGVVEGRNREEAERRFFAEAGEEAHAPGEPLAAAGSAVPAPSAAVLPSSSAPSPRRAETRIVGLFPAPGHRP